MWPILYERQINGHVYDVVFDGVHRSADADLLRIELRQPEKVQRPASCGLPRPEGVVLWEWMAVILRRHGPLTAEALADRMGITAQRASGELSRLRKRGLLCSKRDTGIDNGRTLYWVEKERA